MKFEIGDEGADGKTIGSEKKDVAHGETSRAEESDAPPAYEKS